jgi:hypothetical protein
MINDRGVEELCLRASILFDSHPDWRCTGSDIDRFIRVDLELSYRSTLVMQCASKYGYQIGPTPPRDKHANGIAERAVAIISAKTNLHMLAPSPRVLNKYWCRCMEYTCKTASFIYHRMIGTSPYFFVCGQHVNTNTYIFSGPNAGSSFHSKIEKGKSVSLAHTKPTLLDTTVHAQSNQHSRSYKYCSRNGALPHTAYLVQHSQARRLEDITTCMMSLAC